MLPVTIEKVAAIFTSRDPAISEPAEQALEWATEIAGDFDELCARHQVAWRQTWRIGSIELGVDHDISRNVHLNLFHLLQTVSNNSVGHDVGVPARGLHGEAYRGHIFWDELFVFPFLSTRFPQLTRSLLLYRYRRLDAARRSATQAGFAGAMYPWQSASTGREETQQLHLNPASGRWLPDSSQLQRHVGAAVALNVWQYVQATNDLDFLRFHGGEMILEIARFWASASTYNRMLDRYEIKGVVGPDEYHEGYPDRDEPGLDNNAYTNVMAVWCLCRGLDVLRILPPDVAQDLRERLSLTDAETATWDEISRKMRVCFHDGVISQFEGYEDLEELDWSGLRERHGDIRRLDRILEAEHDTANRYKVAKQADVTMLFFVLSAEELASILERLGYAYDPELIPRTIDYYAARNADGSTLNGLVDAWLHARRRSCAVLEGLHRGARRRRARHPERHDPRGDPPRGHGRHPGSPAAGLRRAGDPRRRAAPASGDPRGAGIARLRGALSPPRRRHRDHADDGHGAGGPERRVTAGDRDRRRLPRPRSGGHDRGGSRRLIDARSSGLGNGRTDRGVRCGR